MLNFDRTRSSTVVIDDAHGVYTLTSERLSVSLSGRFGGLGAAYTHPVSVERDGNVSHVFDTVLIARLLAVLAVTLAALAGTVRR